MALRRGNTARIRIRFRGDVRTSRGLLPASMEGQSVVLLSRRVEFNQTWWRCCCTGDDREIEVAEHALFRTSVGSENAATVAEVMCG